MKYFVTLIIDMPSGIHSEYIYPDIFTAAKAAKRKGVIGNCRIVDDMGIDITPKGSEWEFFINH